MSDVDEALDMTSPLKKQKLDHPSSSAPTHSSSSCSSSTITTAHITQPYLTQLSDDLLVLVFEYLCGNDLLCVARVNVRVSVLLGCVGGSLSALSSHVWRTAALSRYHWNMPFNTPALPASCHLNKRLDESGMEIDVSPPFTPAPSSAHVPAPKPLPKTADHMLNREEIETILENKWRQKENDLKQANPSSPSCSACASPPVDMKQLLLSSSRLSPPHSILVVDMGSCTVTGGLVTFDQHSHRVTCSTPFSFPSISLSPLFGDQISSPAIRDFMQHNQHNNQNINQTIQMPILHGNEKADYEAARELWEYVLTQKVCPGDYEYGGVLICDQLCENTSILYKKRARVAAMIFSILPNLPKLAFCNESLLSLLNVGKLSGIVIHVGFSRSTCSVWLDGSLQGHVPTRMVGGHIHSRILLQECFSKQGQFQPPVADMFRSIPIIKSYCFVSATPPSPSPPLSIDVGLHRPLLLGSERHSAANIFFVYGFAAMVVEALQSSTQWKSKKYNIQKHNTDEHNESDDTLSPTFVHSDVLAAPLTSSALATPGHHALTLLPSLYASSPAPPDSTIGANNTRSTQAPEDGSHLIIKHLLQNIVLSGRSASFRGFAGRLESDLNQILRPSTPAHVYENHVESSWKGGVMLAQTRGAHMWITRKELEEEGINAIIRHSEI